MTQPLQMTEMDKDVTRMYRARMKSNYRDIDRLFLFLLPGQWLFCILCAVFMSPRVWDGPYSAIHLHVWLACAGGASIVSLPMYLIWRRSGRAITRWTVAAAQMLFSALVVHLMGGRIESHFHVFVSLALLAAYRDRMIFLPAVGVTVVDHLLRGFLWPQSVFGVVAVVPWRPFEHAAWVVFEVLALSHIVGQSLQQLRAVAHMQASLRRERDLLETRVEERTQQLEAARDFQEAVLDSIDAGVVVLKPDGEIVFANRKWAMRNAKQVHGQEISCTEVGSNYFDLTATETLHADQYARVCDAIRLLEDNENSSHAVEFRSVEDGQQRWYQVRVNRISLGGVPHVAIVFVDVTDMKAAQSRAASMAKLISESPNEVFVFDRHSFLFVEANNGARENLGFTQDELLAMTPLDLTPHLPAEVYVQKLQPLFAGDLSAIEFETVHRRKDGTEYPCSISLHIGCLEEREVVVAFATDLTARIQLESRLNQAQKLESMGQLAAGIAHEINTPMQCIFGNVEFLQQSSERLFAVTDSFAALLERSGVDWEKEKAILQDLQKQFRYDYIRKQMPLAINEAVDASRRIIGIVRAMKVMSHPGTTEKSVVNVNELLENAATITRNRWKYVSDLKFDFDDNVPTIKALPSELSQVFINMMVNAADAIMDKIGEEPQSLGSILVTTRSDGAFVQVTVEDDGNGMPEHVRKKIFDPFFTTKEVGRGTGQGLSISYDVVVNKHDGEIDVSSQPGIGTKFTIILPVGQVVTDDNLLVLDTVGADSESGVAV